MAGVLRRIGVRPRATNGWQRGLRGIRGEGCGGTCPYVFPQLYGEIQGLAVAGVFSILGESLDGRNPAGVLGGAQRGKDTDSGGGQEDTDESQDQPGDLEG